MMRNACGACVAANAGIAALLSTGRDSPWGALPPGLAPGLLHAGVAALIAALATFVEGPRSSVLTTPGAVASGCGLAFLAAAPAGGLPAATLAEIARGTMAASVAWCTLVLLSRPAHTLAAVALAVAAVALLAARTETGLEAVRAAEAMRARIEESAAAARRPRSWWGV